MNATQQLLISLGVHWQHTLHVPEDLETMYNQFTCAPELVQMLLGVGFDPTELVMPLVCIEDVSDTMRNEVQKERAWRNGRCPAAQTYCEVATAFRLFGEPVTDLYKHHFPFKLFAQQLMEHLNAETTSGQTKEHDVQAEAC